MGHGVSPASPWLDAGEYFLVGLQREDHPEPVGDDQQNGEPEAEFLEHRGFPLGLADQRRQEQGDGGNEQQAGLKAGAEPVELLLVVSQASDQERTAEHEERVGDDRSGDGRLDQQILAGLQCGQRDDEFGQVAERRVQKSANSLSGSVGYRLRRPAEEHRKRDDRTDGKQEEDGVPLRPEMLGCENDRHKHEEP